MCCMCACTRSNKTRKTRKPHPRLPGRNIQTRFLVSLIKLVSQPSPRAKNPVEPSRTSLSYLSVGVADGSTTCASTCRYGGSNPKPCETGKVFLCTFPVLSHRGCGGSRHPHLFLVPCSIFSHHIAGCACWTSGNPVLVILSRLGCERSNCWR
jgi:hypothetical protein